MKHREKVVRDEAHATYLRSKAWRYLLLIANAIGAEEFSLVEKGELAETLTFTVEDGQPARFEVFMGNYTDSTPQLVRLENKEYMFLRDGEQWRQSQKGSN